jgi:hypothetical protein
VAEVPEGVVDLGDYDSDLGDLRLGRGLPEVVRERGLELRAAIDQ